MLWMRPALPMRRRILTGCPKEWRYITISFTARLYCRPFWPCIKCFGTEGNSGEISVPENEGGSYGGSARFLLFRAKAAEICT